MTPAGVAASPKTVGILLFDDVEVLDFAGPYEVFSRCRLEPGVESRRSDDKAPFRVVTVAQTHGPLRATGGLRVLPDHSFDDAPQVDILVVPGGFGTRGLLENSPVLEWISRVAEDAAKVTSVCTGSLVLARLGLLEGRRATTHWSALETLASMGDVRVEGGARFVDDGVITSAGVSAGIDMALHVIETLHGREVAVETARYIEYEKVSG